MTPTEQSVSPVGSRTIEGMFCISNITYSDGRWEHPYYTMDAEAARRYLQFLHTGGWRGMHVERFTSGEWVDWFDRVAIEGDTISFKDGGSWS